MTEITELKAAQFSAYKRYQIAKLNLGKLTLENSVELFGQIAQEANDAWLEFKRVDQEIKNFLTMKKIGDLYYG